MYFQTSPFCDGFSRPHTLLPLPHCDHSEPHLPNLPRPFDALFEDQFVFTSFEAQHQKKDAQTSPHSWAGRLSLSHLHLTRDTRIEMLCGGDFTSKPKHLLNLGEFTLIFTISAALYSCYWSLGFSVFDITFVFDVTFVFDSAPHSSSGSLMLLVSGHFSHLSRSFWIVIQSSVPFVSLPSLVPWTYIITILLIPLCCINEYITGNVIPGKKK